MNSKYVKEIFDIRHKIKNYNVTAKCKAKNGNYKKSENT